MSDTTNAAAQQALHPDMEEISLPTHERERQDFRHLILGNPNYFGNLENSPYPPVLQIAGDTAYEKLMCVGFNPELSQLEGVVYIMQSTGYHGGLCSKGSPEYVRFYLSYNGGATWIDQGITSFQAHDIPGAKPLEYAVTLRIHPDQLPCEQEHLAQVRAILSFNNPPPPGQPNFVPVWGNVVEANIQIAPKLAHKPILGGALEAVTSLSALPAITSVAGSQQADQHTAAPAHRALYPYLQHLIDNPGLTDALMAPDFPGYLPGVADPAAVMDLLLKTSGDTSFEHLDCVGLDPNTETLEAVLTVKRPTGYLGGLCTHGSREYVAFWLDWNDGNGWTYAGTASVGVHDIKSIPQGGLQYAVALPLNDWSRRKPCNKGAVTPRVRAVLSWQAPPPPADPDYLPHWGNRRETRVQIKPGVAYSGHTPIIETVGSMAVDHISGLTGLANGAPVGYVANDPQNPAPWIAKDSPFGGVVEITGHITNFGLPGTLKYRVLISNDGVNWQPLTNPYWVTVDKTINGQPAGLTNVHQVADPNDNWYYTYQEGTNGMGTSWSVAKNLLATWQTAGLNGLYHIKMEVKDAANNTYQSVPITVCLDNTPPQVDIAITSGGGNCADFQIGQAISGTYSVSDLHFGSLNLVVEPGLGGTWTSPVLPRVYPVVPTGGEAGTWSLDTSGMPKCGYVLKVAAVDRTIVNSAYVGLYSEKAVGLCLRQP